MPNQALHYISAVISAGLLTLLAAAPLWQPGDMWAFIACCTLAVMASTFKVALPGLTGTISPGFVFVLVAVATLSWSETVAVAAVAGAVQTLWQARKRPLVLQVAFNAASVGLSAAMAHGVAWGALPLQGLEARLAVAGIVLLVCNTLLVSTLLCLLSDAPLTGIFRALQMWAFPYYLAGGILSTVWARVDLGGSAAFTLFAAISLYLLHCCYSAVVERVPHSHSRTPLAAQLDN